MLSVSCAMLFTPHKLIAWVKNSTMWLGHLDKVYGIKKEGFGGVKTIVFLRIHGACGLPMSLLALYAWWKKMDSYMHTYIMILALMHSVSYAVVVYCANRWFKQQASQIKLTFFVTPKSLANMWRFLFGGGFLRSNDKLLVVCGLVHIGTTLAIISSLLIQLIK